MLYSRFVVLILLIKVASIELSAAELYKWKDEKGVTHFSEKKPDNINSVEALALEQGKVFNDVVQLAAMVKPDDLANRHIVVLQSDSFWNLSNLEKKTTSYYFGGDCVSPSTTSFQAMKDNHSQFLKQEKFIIDTIKKEIRRFNYSSSVSRKQPLKRNLARHEAPVVLRVSLADFEFHACVTNLKRRYNRYKKTHTGDEPFEYSPGDFDRRRARLSLSWQLEDGDTGEKIFSGMTSGSANHWDRDVHKYRLKTIRDAVKSATANLLADEAFVKLVTSINDKVALQPKAFPKRSKPGFFQSLSDAFSSKAKRRSSFARVLGDTSILKTSISEFYANQGEWPKTLNDLGFSKVDVIDHEYVSDVEIDYDGAIVLELAAGQFEDNAMLSLRPKVSMGGAKISWKCLTNLDDSYYADYCSQVE